MSTRAKPSFDEALLERYLDGELDAGQVRRLTEAAAQDPGLAAELDARRALRQLLRDELLAVAEEVSFDGLTDRVLAEVARAQPLPWHQRLGTWLGEVFTYRKPIWVPSLAMAGAAAAALVLVLPRVIDPPPQVSMRELAANAGVEVRSLETGTQLAMVYQLPASQTTVIWIADTGESAEEIVP